MKKLILFAALSLSFKSYSMKFQVPNDSLPIEESKKHQIIEWFKNKNIIWGPADPKVKLFNTGKYYMITTAKSHAQKFLSISSVDWRQIMIKNGVILAGKINSTSGEFEDKTEESVNSF